MLLRIHWLNSYFSGTGDSVPIIIQLYIAAVRESVMHSTVNTEIARFEVTVLQSTISNWRERAKKKWMLAWKYGRTTNHESSTLQSSPRIYNVHFKLYKYSGNKHICSVMVITHSGYTVWSHQLHDPHIHTIKSTQTQTNNKQHRPYTHVLIFSFSRDCIDKKIMIQNELCKTDINWR